MSGSQILADMHPNPTFPLRHGPNKVTRPDKPGRRRGPRDWRSFVLAEILCKEVKITKKHILQFDM